MAKVVRSQFKGELEILGQEHLHPSQGERGQPVVQEGGGGEHRPGVPGHPGVGWAHGAAQFGSDIDIGSVQYPDQFSIMNRFWKILL